MSKDEHTARRALDKAVAERDEATVRLGLKNHSVRLRQEVFRVIANLDYQWFVPDLLKSLKENQNVNGGESHPPGEQAKLNMSIVSALQNLTGLGFFANEKKLSAGEFQKIKSQTLQWYAANKSQIEQSRDRERLMMRQKMSISSEFYYSAARAFEKAVAENDRAALRLGLKARFTEIKDKAAARIGQLDDQSFVPDLIEALDGNRSMLEGGTETAIAQNLLDRQIIFAIEKLTGLQFSFYEKSVNRDRILDRSYAGDIERVLKESCQWCKTHIGKCDLKNKADK